MSDTSGRLFTRGIPTSIFHNVSQGVMYTNFYYAKTTAGGATTITLNFSGGRLISLPRFPKSRDLILPLRWSVPITNR